MHRRDSAACSRAELVAELVAFLRNAIALCKASSWRASVARSSFRMLVEISSTFRSVRSRASSTACKTSATQGGASAGSLAAITRASADLQTLQPTASLRSFGLALACEPTCQPVA